MAHSGSNWTVKLFAQTKYASVSAKIDVILIS